MFALARLIPGLVAIRVYDAWYINVEQLRVDRDQLWAEAVALYGLGKWVGDGWDAQFVGPEIANGGRGAQSLL